MYGAGFSLAQRDVIKKANVRGGNKLGLSLENIRSKLIEQEGQVNYTIMAKIILITDSRGLNFEPILKEAISKLSPSMDVNVLAVQGANLLSIEDAATKELATNRYDQAYIMLGVNNLTKF